MIMNKKIKCQIDIDEKPLNLIGTKEENRFVGGVDYYIFAFLFQVLVVADRL